MSQDDILNPGGEEKQEPEVPAKGLSGSRLREEPRGKLHSYNWLADISDPSDCDIVQVQFKNTRNGFYVNNQHLDLAIGDLVAVEASPGHDIGRVSMVGRLVRLQMRKAGIKPETELKKVFRKARQADIEKFEEAKAREHETMIRSRRIAEELGLDMKIGDVEYQGDGGKAIFYYIADERVDFRKLIRILADAFHVRIEMKQIGARQEAGRIGGIGPCGRPLCCSSWMSHFVSVGTSAARFQDLSMNPQKLAGQCAKLKCCLNFEVDVYMESQRKLPPKDHTLETLDNTYYPFKTDVLKKRITYSTDKRVAANLVTLDARTAFEILAQNKQGVKPEALVDVNEKETSKNSDFVDLVGQDSLTRFDKSRKKKKKKPKPQQAPPKGDAQKPREGGQRQRPQRRPERKKQGDAPRSKEQKQQAEPGPTPKTEN